MSPRPAGRLPRRPDLLPKDAIGSDAIADSGLRHRVATGGRRGGVLIHEVIQDLVAAGHREFTREYFQANIARRPEVSVEHLSRRHLLIAAVSRYFKQFVHADWEFVGYEIRTRDGEAVVDFDLVWRIGTSSAVVIDEIKTGRERDLTSADRARAALLARAGAAQYVDFAYLRWIHLRGGREASWAVLAGGDLVPLVALEAER